MHDETRAEARIDDCWNRIGVRGDRSCERLVRHVHCRNCEVFEAAAATLRDRLAVTLDDAPPAMPEAVRAGRSHVLFRVAAVWLGLPTASLDAIVEPGPVHSLPHGRSAALLGVTNVRGTLAPCFDLRALLELESGEVAAASRRAVPQMLIVGDAAGRVAVPVDEVVGIETIAEDDIVAPGKEAASPLHAVASGVVRRQGRSITLIDHQRLAASVSACFG